MRLGLRAVNVFVMEEYAEDIAIVADETEERVEEEEAAVYPSNEKDMTRKGEEVQKSRKVRTNSGTTLKI